MDTFGDRMRQLMTERGMSLRELARRTYYTPGYLSKVVNGKEKPGAELAVRLEKVLDADGTLTRLVPSAPPPARRDALKVGLGVIAPEALPHVLRESAADALEFTRQTGVSTIGAGTLDHLEMVVAELDRSYSRQLPADQFVIAREYRLRVHQMIHGRHTLKEARELYVYAGWLSEMLAWLAHDLGDPLTAEAWAIDSFEHADQAGHDELCGWAADAMCSIAMYAGSPARAVKAAGKGIRKAPVDHPLGVRMRAQAARAHARLGERDACEEMFTEATQVHELLPARSPARWSTDTATLAAYAMTAYPASAWIWLGDFQQARRHAQDALAVHDAASGGSPSREAIARIDLGLALANLGEPDEAAALGRQALTSPRLVDSVLNRVSDLDRVLTNQYPTLGEVRGFHEQYLAAVS